MGEYREREEDNVNSRKTFNLSFLLYTFSSYNVQVISVYPSQHSCVSEW